MPIAAAAANASSVFSGCVPADPRCPKARGSAGLKKSVLVCARISDATSSGFQCVAGKLRNGNRDGGVERCREAVKNLDHSAVSDSEAPSAGLLRLLEILCPRICALFPCL